MLKTLPHLSLFARRFYAIAKSVTICSTNHYTAVVQCPFRTSRPLKDSEHRQHATGSQGSTSMAT